MPCFKGDPHRQISTRTWIHWCRVLKQTLIDIDLDYCDHCHDPSPKVQAQIHEQQIAMFEGKWCEEHERVYTKYIDGVNECRECIIDQQMYEMRS